MSRTLRPSSSVSLLAALLAIAGCGNSTTPADMGASPDLAPAARHLTLLYTNDEHSHLVGFAPELDDHPAPTVAGKGDILGGIARRKVLLDRERAAARAAGADTLTLSGGDVAMGTLAQVAFTTSAPDYVLMKQLGYDVACVGNHEFDFGPAALAAAITAAMGKGGLPQLMSTNLHFDGANPADDALAAHWGDGTTSKPIKSWHVLTTPGGLKVGFIGILGANAAYVAPLKTPVRGSGDSLEEADTAAVLPKIYADLQPAVDTLRNEQKVDLVIAVSHAGVDLDHPEMGDDWNIAQHVAGIDVIVSGHTHTKVDKPIVVKNPTTGKDVLIVQAGSYGRFLGRLVLSVAPDGSLSHDPAASQLLVVDDTTVADPGIAAGIDQLIAGIEGTPLPGAPSSFLEAALSRTLGMSVANDAGKIGDLYFYKLGDIGYDIVGLGGGSSLPSETNLLNLSADAMFAAATANLPGEQPDFAIQAAGVVRSNLKKGKTGVIGFSDVFRILPLGGSPVDHTIGYPLVHVYLPLFLVRAALELGVGQGLVNSDFFLGVSGMRITADASRPLFNFADPFSVTGGRITKIEWNTHHDGAESYDAVIFDATNPDTLTSGPYANKFFHAITNFYIASFASSIGAPLYDKTTSMPITPDKAIVHRADGSEVKDFEALAAYIVGLKTMPSRYDATTADGKVPRRVLLKP